MNRPLGIDEGHFIAGFIEGEGYFGIAEANGGQSFRCLMSLALRDDDADLLRWIQERTAIGTLSPIPARRTSKPQVQWLVRTRDDCRALVELLTRYPMRGRKRRDFEIWTEAVELWTTALPYRAVMARRLRRELSAVRRFRPPGPQDVVPVPHNVDALRGYLHGFMCAEGSLGLGRSSTTLAVHLRRDDRPLLEMFARALEVGDIRDQRAYPPANPSSTWQVGRLDEVTMLAEWLVPEQLRGRKAAELEVWLRGVAERRSAKAEGRRAQMDALVAEFRAARAYRPGAPPVAAPARPDRRAETVELLREWAASEPGPLSCRAYAAARHPRWPNRNTIARRFGSWDAALAAAGLSGREASTSGQRRRRMAGGASERAEHAELQRQRVLATLRYAINVHGSVPTAMQFFRWRLVNAPATPTQAAVYRLFPGGWQAVLDALGEVDPRLLA